MEENIDKVAEAHFLCSACNNEAGHIQLLRGPSSAELRRNSFTSVFSSVVSQERFEKLRKAIADHDARALHSLDLEYTPFFCPKCDAIYCGDHWETWDVFDEDDPLWHDSTRGRCPHGHERMLED